MASLSSPQKNLGWCSPWFKGPDRENVLKQGCLFVESGCMDSQKHQNLEHMIWSLISCWRDDQWCPRKWTKKWIIYGTLLLYFSIKKKAWVFDFPFHFVGHRNLIPALKTCQFIGREASCVAGNEASKRKHPPETRPIILPSRSFSRKFAPEKLPWRKANRKPSLVWKTTIFSSG